MADDDDVGTRWVRRTAVINNDTYNEELNSLMNIAGEAIELARNLAEFNEVVTTAFEEKGEPPDYATMVRAVLHLGSAGQSVCNMLATHMVFYEKTTEEE